MVLKGSERRKKVKVLEHLFLSNATNQVVVMGIHTIQIRRVSEEGAAEAAVHCFLLSEKKVRIK